MNASICFNCLHKSITCLVDNTLLSMLFFNGSSNLMEAAQWNTTDTLSTIDFLSSIEIPKSCFITSPSNAIIFFLRASFSSNENVNGIVLSIEVNRFEADMLFFGRSRTYTLSMSEHVTNSFNKSI